MDNRQLRQNVLDEIDYEPSIHAKTIGVAVDGDVVTLTGHVGNYAEKLAAERSVRRVKGVRALANEIEVRYPGHKQTSDDEIAQRILSILKWDAWVPLDAIQATVSSGWVTLSGTVDWQYQRKAAEDSIRKLSGILGVINNIAIKPRLVEADVKKKVEAALLRSAEIEAKAIRVTIEGGNKVVLEGHVDSWNEADTAEMAAWSAPGVQSVKNRLSYA